MFKTPNDKQMLLSTLWIVIMFNMIFADFYSVFVLMVEGTTPDIPGDVKTIMLIAVFVTNIPIMMILLTRILTYRLNRWVNIVAGFFTILYVVGAGDTTPHYLATATIEVMLLGAIIWIAFNWRAPMGTATA